MRPRSRSESGSNAPRSGRPLELVRVRGSQRDTGPEGRDLRRGSRRRGGRGRGRGTPRAAVPAPRHSLWDWFRSLVTADREPRKATITEQESRVLDEFSRHYRITFNDAGLLKLALTHRSYLSMTGQGPRESNERLEFLGDSVLGLVTSEFLYLAHPNEHEGQLTKTKSLLVSKAILSRRALGMGLGRFVLMSHSEVESGGRQRLSIMADAFEAVVGAVYLDQGFEAARAFIERYLLRDSREISADKRHVNYKSQLQEYVQSNFRTHPVYRIRSEVGPDHSKQFIVEVSVGRRPLGEGKGPNKKEAEQAAARDAIERVSESGRRREAPVIEDETEDAESTPRRRGRRGGRGRRRPGGEAPAPGASPAEAESPPPLLEEAIEPEAPPRRAREREAAPSPRPPGREAVPPRPRAPSREAPARPRPPARQIPPAEVEPVPRPYEEDENEEVGRPEGPLEERHVDPYELETEPPADDHGEAPEEEPADRPAPPEERAEDEPTGPDAPSSAWTEEDREPWTGEPRETPPSKPGAGEGTTRFGRRRGRRPR